MSDTHIEGLTELVERVSFATPGSELMPLIVAVLADPAIAPHIPAVKALQEELASKESIIQAYERDIEKFTVECVKAGIGDEHSPEAAIALLAYRIATLEATNAAHAEQLAKLEAELETERLRLAACSVAALGYFDGCKDEYRSASLEDVLRLVDHIFTLKTRLSEIKPGRVGASGMLHPAYVEGYNYAAEQVQEALLQSSTPAEAQLAGGGAVAIVETVNGSPKSFVYTGAVFDLRDGSHKLYTAPAIKQQVAESFESVMCEGRIYQVQIPQTIAQAELIRDHAAKWLQTKQG